MTVTITVKRLIEILSKENPDKRLDFSCGNAKLADGQTLFDRKIILEPNNIEPISDDVIRQLLQ